MKTRTFLLLAVLFSYIFSPAQEATPAMQKAATKVCNCLDKIDFKSPDTKKSKEESMNCFTNEVLADYVAIAEERKVDITDKDAMQALGVELGKYLLKIECKGYIEFAKISASEDEEQFEVKSTGGKVSRIDIKDFAYVVIKDKSGREQSFIWLEYFPGSEQLTGTKINSLIGKEITVKWQEKEVYLPKAGDYYQVKQIISLSY